MRYKHILAVSLIMIAVSYTTAAKSTLFKNGKTSYAIVIFNDASVLMNDEIIRHRV